MDWKIAFPLHPEYRTLPMVWYVPPLSPIQLGGRGRARSATTARCRTCATLRIPVRYLANLLTAGEEAPVVAALERMLAMRGYMRAKTVDGVIDEGIAERVGLTASEDRGHVPDHGDRRLRGPLRHPDRASRTRRGGLIGLRGGCGFTYGNGCSSGVSSGSLFGGKRARPDHSGGDEVMIRTLKALSALLTYPDAELQAAAPDIADRIAGRGAA